MTTGEALPARSDADQAIGGASVAPTQSTEPAASATAATADLPPPEKELLCTICGLRACWTEAGPPKSPSS